MKWIMQENLISDEQVTQFEDAFKRWFIPFELVKVVPFVGEVNVKSKDDFLIPYGSTRLSNYAYDNKWKGMFFNESFKTSVWKENRDDLLNGDARIMSVSKAKEILSKEGDRDWFIRPDNDLKEFAGFKVSNEEFIGFIDRISGANGNLLNEDTQIAAASIKKITAEWRWFIVDGDIVDGSMYKLKDRLYKKHEDDIDIINEAQDLADMWLPHETCVMDTALVDGETKVIEFNCLNSSGVYDNNVDKIVWFVTEYVKMFEKNKGTNLKGE